MKISPAQFEHAIAALVVVLRFEFPADAILSRYFREHRDMGPADRAVVAEAVYGVLRKKRLLDHVTANGKARALLLAWLARGLGLNSREIARDLEPVLRRGDYLVVEDTCVNGHPVRPEFGPGPWEAVEAFLAEHPGSLQHDATRENKFGFTAAPRGFFIKT